MLSVLCSLRSFLTPHPACSCSLVLARVVDEVEAAALGEHLLGGVANEARAAAVLVVALHSGRRQRRLRARGGRLRRRSEHLPPRQVPRADEYPIDALNPRLWV